jgi:hypothetical protein
MISQGARRQSDDAPAGRNGARLPVHLARHRRRRAHQPPDSGDVPGRDRRDRPSRCDHRKSAASQHAEADGGGADRRPCAPRGFRLGVSNEETPSPIRCRLQARAAAVQASGAWTSRAGDFGVNPFSPCGRRWREAPNEGSGRDVRDQENHQSRSYSADLSRNRAEPAPDGANPSSGPSGHLPPQGGKGIAPHPSLIHTSISPGSRLSQAK